MPDLGDVAKRLRQEARATRQRRMVVLHGPAPATRQAALSVLDAAGIGADDAVAVTRQPLGDLRACRPDHAGDLLGTTQHAVVLDAHDTFRPDVLGRVVGTVDGGGLLLLLCPPLDAWPDRRDDADRRLAVPPYDVSDVTGRFRRRLVSTLRAHDGIAIVDVDADHVEDDGLTGATEAPPTPDVEVPDDARLPATVYEACRTPDQARALRALEEARDPSVAVVVESDRGRGKSSAAGLAAGAFAADGADVLVTAPRPVHAAEVLARAREVLEGLGKLAAAEDRHLQARSGGRVRYRPPADAAAAPGDPAVLVVDEAAALPARLLADLLDVQAGAVFATTIHGYEGAGRGFSVRFMAHLRDSPRTVRDVRLETPIRYAPGDPVERWSFHALLLDARPVPDEAVADIETGGVTYRRPTAEDLLADEDLLGQAFGLLVQAHYRTTPDDLARLLDAPNLSVRLLAAGDRVVAGALLAREGGLDAETRRRTYEGGTIAGNLIPDVLTSQLRDVDAGVPVGVRVMRIAVHPAARRRGLGSLLLRRIHDEVDVDWVGTSYGATPGLLRFWHANGYRSVHLSTRRNPASGERSAVMLRPVTPAGRALHRRSTGWFLERIAAVLSDALSDADPDAVRGVLATVDGTVDLDLSERAWRLVAAAAWGPGMYDVDPAPFRRLALKTLVEGVPDLDADQERLLVRKVLQAWPWDPVVEDLGYVSTRMAMKELGRTYRPVVEAHGSDAALEEADRYR